MLVDGVIALLIADTTVNGLIAGRAYEGELPRGYGLPAIAVHQYGGTQEYQMDGPVDVREDQIQLDGYGRNALETRQLREAARKALIGFTGVLPDADATVVQACFLERDMDMPFLPHADQKGIANRSTLGFRVITKRV